MGLLGCARLIWIFAAWPGRTHGITAARHDHILTHLRATGLGALADLGFRGLDHDVRDPVLVTDFHTSRTHKLTPGQKEANRVLAAGRARLRPPQELAGTHQAPHRTSLRPPARTPCSL
ncbi:transposase family protein [Streptomyces sp. NPDC006296]|uniref:transposase family protein n=1 Tax=Streptomyces sp. NPDC006296 TaxID=3156746 RepID=UPI0033B2F8D7